MSISEPPDRVKKYLVEHKLTFPALLDSDSRAATLYGIRGTPTRFLISREGKLIAGSIGPRDWAGDEVRRLIETLLGADKKPRQG